MLVATDALWHVVAQTEIWKDPEITWWQSADTTGLELALDLKHWLAHDIRNNFTFKLDIVASMFLTIFTSYTF